MGELTVKLNNNIYNFCYKNDFDKNTYELINYPIYLSPQIYKILRNVAILKHDRLITNSFRHKILKFSN